MLSELAAADALTWVSIFVKALTYATTLLAAGSVLVHLSLRSLDGGMRQWLAWLAAGSAIASALLSLIRLPVRASFLTGGSVEGAVDPMLLGVVAESPLGTSVTWRLIGLALILAILVPNRGGNWIAGAGAVLVAASFSLRGHALEEPRLLLAGLVTVHILGLAFWLGAFAPLARATASRDPKTAGRLLDEFGRKALWVVGALVGAGVLTLVQFGAATPDAFQSPYGQAFAIKLSLFAGVLSLAAVNKLHLTPALADAVPGAGTRVRRSIRLEAGLIAAILIATAAATTVSAPRGATGQAGFTADPDAPKAVAPRVAATA